MPLTRKKCEHGKQKTRCKDCGGASICEHGREKYICRDCGGSSICEHGRQKNLCKDCGGISICEHGRNRSYCKECGGASICEHGRQKSRCKDCGGASICEHGRQKPICKECNGICICKHGKRKSRCKDCGGASICNHGILKYNCKNCSGNAFCEHGKNKSRCKDCGGSALCRSPLCELYGIKKYNGYCYRCFINLFPDDPIIRNHKTKERAVADYIKEHFQEYTIVLDKRIQDGCSSRRPDIFIDLGEYILVIEIDENQHQSYDCSCENKRLMQLFQDAGNRPLVMIRFNPDQYYDHTGKSVPSCWGYTKDKGLCHVKPNKQKEWQDRLNVLNDHIKYFCENKIDKEINIEHLFYDNWSL